MPIKKIIIDPSIFRLLFILVLGFTLISFLKFTVFDILGKEIDGMVVEVKESHISKDGPYFSSYYGDVEYEVNGEIYTKSHVYLGRSSMNSSAQFANEIISITYLPTNPNWGLVTSTSNDYLGMSIFTFVSVIGIAVTTLLLPSNKRGFRIQLDCIRYIFIHKN